MPLNFEPLARCILVLEKSLNALNKAEKGSTEHEMYRNAVVKSFEMTLEMAGKSVRRALKEYTAIPRSVRELTFKDVFRYGAKYGLIEDPESWFSYRDSRNNTVHDYGEDFADTVLKIIHQFHGDVAKVYATLMERHGQPID